MDSVIETQIKVKFDENSYSLIIEPAPENTRWVQLSYEDEKDKTYCISFPINDLNNVIVALQKYQKAYQTN